jgi:Immunity protein Imm1
MTLATGHVVTALVDEGGPYGEVPLGTREDSAWTYAYDAAGRARLVEAVFGLDLRHPNLPAKRQIYAWDRPCRSDFVFSEQYGFRSWHSEGESQYPNQCLRLVIEPGHRFGALHYYGPTATGDDGIWVTRTPNPATTDEPFYFDSEGDVEFPADSLLPLTELRPIVAEHVETGVRPECVDWQPFHVL